MIPIRGLSLGEKWMQKLSTVQAYKSSIEDRRRSISILNM